MKLPSIIKPSIDVLIVISLLLLGVFYFLSFIFTIIINPMYLILFSLFIYLYIKELQGKNLKESFKNNSINKCLFLGLSYMFLISLKTPYILYNFFDFSKLTSIFIYSPIILFISYLLIEIIKEISNDIKKTKKVSNV